MPDAHEGAMVACARAAQAAGAPMLLAVSGGLDSMVLLHVMAAVARSRVAAVATFDHGTGAHATRAARLVERTARRMGLPVVAGRRSEPLPRAGGLEAAWRAARYDFLRGAAAERGACVVTAHTRDDQLETVLMRTMRGSGARGLAALLAPSAIVRPLLGCTRAELARLAGERDITWVEDPSNASMAFLRNRVRHEILPALRRVDPQIDRALLDLGRRAAAWRAELDSVVEAIAEPRRRGGGLVVAATELRGYDRDSLMVIWGALAGRAGLALDRRGTQRCVEFTMKGTPRGCIPLSGGWRLEARPDELVLYRERDLQRGDLVLPGAGTLQWGRFRFRPAPDADLGSPWTAVLPSSAEARVRGWRPGDRLSPSGGKGLRRVTRYLSEAGVVGSERARWPVVVLDGAVVWIPGVRRSDAATERSGRPGRHYVCERTID